MQPATAAQAHDWANANPPKAYWYSSGCGRIEIALTLEDARSGSHQGQCDDDVAALRTLPYIKEQLDALSVDTVRNELQGYGAWDDDELADHDQNLNRILWSACCDIREENIGVEA